jgi:hypothetical protein
MTTGAMLLTEALRQQDRRRLRLDELRAIWRRADPIAATSEDAHVRFRQTLTALQTAGVIALPTSAPAWDRSVTPPLPRSIVVTATLPRGRSETAATAWVPELSFAASERHRATLDALHAINDWLKRNRGRPLPSVPVPERSLEIFGDEKRLDGLTEGESLFGGRLRLADLACARLPPFLIWHPSRSASALVLVVENAAAFDSFRRFNERAGLWRAVVWGAGNAFRRHHAGLNDIFAATGAGRALYFGDLDPRGVEILAAVMRERGDLRPHRRLYAALMARRMVRHEPGASVLADRCSAALRAHLPDLAEAVLALWRDGMVLPQEGYGAQALVDDPGPAGAF